VYEQFGFGLNADGTQRFQLFIPSADVDRTQYERGGPCRIERIRVVGDFLGAMTPARRAWNTDDGLEMARKPHPNGILFEAVVDPPLAPGFYEYKYYVDFTDIKGRWVSDPCAKISGRSDGNSACVVDAAQLASVDPLPAALSDLVVYEIMVDDFTRSYRGARAPLDALLDRVDYVAAIGVSAIELMPCGARPDDEAFSWGYDPVQFFAIENAYVEDPATPLDRRVRLQRLVQAAHARHLSVLLDIVLQHAKCPSSDFGFAYYYLWQDPNDSPFIGTFVPGGTFGSMPLDYDNACTLQFASDVCLYWLKTYGLDGLRFDQTSGFFRSQDVSQGLPAIVGNIQRGLAGRASPALTVLEDTWDYGAIDRTNEARASGCWLDPYRTTVAAAVSSGVRATMIRALNACLDFAPGANPVIYLENHDHSGATQLAGGRAIWFRTQPAAIALFASPGGVLLRNGQEFGWDVLLLEDDSHAPPELQRVQPRTIPLSLADDGVGQQLRAVYRVLADMRAAHPALRGPNFFPWPYDERQADFDGQGYGANVDRQLVIFHRWGAGALGGTERFMVVLNFAPWDQFVDVPLPVDGAWSDLLGGPAVTAVQGWARGTQISSNWGKVLFRRD
jgi:glycosidase